MTEELPDNVDLRWLGQTLIDLRREMRAGFAAVRRDVEGLTTDVRRLREDFDLLLIRVMRMDASLTALRDDMRLVWETQGDLRRRIEALEEK